MIDPTTNPHDVLRAASYLRHAAGMTPRSASLRWMMRSFQTGGPRVFKNHSGARESHSGQDFRAMQPLDMRSRRAPDTLGEFNEPQG